MKKISGVFKGLGGSATTHRQGYEGLVALEQVSQMPKGAAQLFQKVRSAFGKNTTSAMFVLKKIDTEIGSNPLKRQIFADGIEAGFTLLFKQSRYKDMLQILTSLGSYYPPADHLFFQACIESGCDTIPGPLPDHLRSDEGAGHIVTLAQHYATHEPHRLIVLAIMCRRSGSERFESALNRELPTLYSESAMTDDLAGLYQRGEFRALLTLVREGAESPFFGNRLSALRVTSLPWLNATTLNTCLFDRNARLSTPRP